MTQVCLTENLLPADQLQPPVQADGVWVFGFDRRLEPKEDVRMNASLLNWLEARTGLSYRLHVTPRDGNVVDDLCNGEIQFAIVGTVSYLQAHHRCGVRILVRGLNAVASDFRSLQDFGSLLLLDERIDLPLGDEVGDLAEAFNQMAAEIQGAIQRLQVSEAGYRDLLTAAGTVGEGTAPHQTSEVKTSEVYPRHWRFDRVAGHPPGNLDQGRVGDGVGAGDDA